jgi:hypothetical protein
VPQIAKSPAVFWIRSKALLEKYKLLQTDKYIHTLHHEIMLRLLGLAAPNEADLTVSEISVTFVLLIDLIACATERALLWRCHQVSALAI